MVLMEPPIAVYPCVFCQRMGSLVWEFFGPDLQLSGRELLQDISRLIVKDPEQCLIREARDFVPHPVYIVHRIAFRQPEIWLHWP